MRVSRKQILVSKQRRRRPVSGVLLIPVFRVAHYKHRLYEDLLYLCNLVFERTEVNLRLFDVWPSWKQKFVIIHIYLIVESKAHCTISGKV